MTAKKKIWKLNSNVLFWVLCILLTSVLCCPFFTSPYSNRNPNESNRNTTRHFTLWLKPALNLLHLITGLLLFFFFLWFTSTSAFSFPLKLIQLSDQGSGKLASTYIVCTGEVWEMSEIWCQQRWFKTLARLLTSLVYNIPLADCN